jgi:hypothetical protein
MSDSFIYHQGFTEQIESLPQGATPVSVDPDKSLDWRCSFQQGGHGMKQNDPGRSC